MTYLTWAYDRDTYSYEGTTANGRRLFTIEKRKHGTYLRRSNGSVEKCSSIQHAKDYADQLARLANFAPIGGAP